MNIIGLEDDLGGASPAEVLERIGSCTDTELQILLDCRFSRIADAAADILVRRKAYNVVVSALMNGRFRTIKGKLRAGFVLNQFGKSVPNASTAYEALLKEKNSGVLSNALFGLVFLRARSNINLIQEQMEKWPQSSKQHKLFNKAVLALSRDDPKIYSSNFHDAKGIWY